MTSFMPKILGDIGNCLSRASIDRANTDGSQSDVNYAALIEAQLIAQYLKSLTTTNLPSMH